MANPNEAVLNVTSLPTMTFDGNATTASQPNVTECLNDYCVSEEEYLNMIWDYIWPNPYEWVLICFYMIVFIVGLIGNFLVCFAVWRNHSMRTVTNYFIVNLAIADFSVILICLPPTVLGDTTETWYMGSVMCKIVKYLQGVSVGVSVLTLTCISIERWYAICHPLMFKATPERAKLMIVIIWFISLAIMIPELVVLNTRHSLPPFTVLLTSCRPTWSQASQAGYQLFLSCAMYVVPFILMFVAYYQIARCLWSNTIPTETSRDHLNPREGTRTGGELQLQARRKAAKMLIAVVVMFGICYLPVHLLNILRYANVMSVIAHRAPTVPTMLALASHWLCYFNSAINPCIYNFMSAKFRKEFQKVFLCCACCPCCPGDTRAPKDRRDQTYTYRYTNSLPQQHNQLLNRITATKMTNC